MGLFSSSSAFKVDLFLIIPFRSLADLSLHPYTFPRVVHGPSGFRGSPRSLPTFRYLYSADALPNWAGKLEGNIDLREYLLSKGVELQAIEAEEAPMDEDAEDLLEEDTSMEEKADDEDIQDGTPVQASTMVANGKNLKPLSGTLGNLQGATFGKPSVRVRTTFRNLRKDLQKRPLEQPKAELPPPRITLKPVVIESPPCTTTPPGDAPG